MPKFKTKPIEIDAIQFTGDESCEAVTEFFGGYNATNHQWKACTHDGGFIHMLQGDSEFRPGDWILSLGDGEHFYVCKPDIFAETYEAVES
jgi:hypothetical protein